MKKLTIFILIIALNYTYTQTVFKSNKQEFVSKKHHFKIKFPCVPDVIKEGKSTIFSCMSYKNQGIYRVYVEKLTDNKRFTDDYINTYINEYKNLAEKNNIKYKLKFYRGEKAIETEVISYVIGAVTKNRTLTLLKFGNSYNVSVTSDPKLLDKFYIDFINSFDFTD